MFDWSDARIFLSVCAKQSFAAAGKDLGIDGSTVGRRIAALETALRAKLFRRGPAGLKLTPAGEEARELAGQMQSVADSLDRRIRGHDRGSEGVVRLTTIESLARAFLVPRLPAFHELHPRIELSINTDSRLLSLVRREADLAIRHVRPSQPGLVARKIGRVAFALYASPAYLAKPREPGRTFCLGLDDELAAMPDAEWLGETAGSRVPLRSSNRAVLESAAMAGLGAALLPCYLGDGRKDVVRVRPPDPVMVRDLWLVLHQELQSSGPVRVVADALVDMVRGGKDTLLGRVPAGA
jgi:DNA-binding transcriptional LysR family regulator